MLEFRSLASSSSGCCYVLSGGGSRQPLLIEAGIRLDLIQRGLDFGLSRLAGCVISHCHGDHARSALKLMAMAVDCYASDETWAQLSKCRQVWEHRAHVVKPREVTMVGDWSVLPAEAIHDAPGTLSYIIGSPEGDMLLFLTDSAYSPYRYKGVTQIAVECNWSEDIIKENVVDGVIDRDRFRRTASTHMSLERLVEMLKANDLSNCEAIYLIHLSNANSNEEEFKKTIQRATGVPVYVCAEISQS